MSRNFSRSALMAILMSTSAVPAGAVAAYAPAGVVQGVKPATGGLIKGLVDKGLVSLATVFTNAGAALVTQRMTQAGTTPKNIGWGIGTTAAAVTDTALVTESAPTTSGGRTVGTESRTTVTNTNDNIQYVGTVTAGGSLAITEAGTFDNVTAGNMLIRSVFSAINVVNNDTIQFTFGLKFVPG